MFDKPWFLEDGGDKSGLIFAQHFSVKCLEFYHIQLVFFIPLSRHYNNMVVLPRCKKIFLCTLLLLLAGRQVAYKVCIT